jgi:hypothetical protein
MMRTILWGAALLLAACSSDAPPVGRIDFLLNQDTTRAYVLDSAFHTDFTGVPPLDPPYEAGLNHLTILRDVHTANMSLEQTLPLGNDIVRGERPTGFLGGGWLSVFALSPDGDTALLARIDPNEILVVRGLKANAPYLSQTLPFPDLPSAITISPDGSWALVGNGTNVGPGPLKLYVVSGLPAHPVVFSEIELGPEEEIDCGGVSEIRITDDGKRALLVNWWGLVHQPIVDEQSLILIREPGPGGVQQVMDKLVMPLEPAIPPPPEFEGKNVGQASGSFAVLWDSDSAVVPAVGHPDLGVVDARILLISGMRTGQLRIVRTLGPADGVEISPFYVARLPDSDRVVLSHLFAGKFTILSGLGDPTFSSVTLETFDGELPVMGSLAVTPDGGTVVLSTARGPLDNLPPSHVTNWSYDGQSIVSLGPAVYGPVREMPFLRGAGIKTMRPGLNDYVACCQALPQPARESLTSKVNEAVVLADQGMDQESIETLSAFSAEVDVLVTDGVLQEHEARIMHTLAGLAEDRLR